MVNVEGEGEGQWMVDKCAGEVDVEVHGKTTCMEKRGTEEVSTLTPGKG